MKKLFVIVFLLLIIIGCSNPFVKEYNYLKGVHNVEIKVKDYGIITVALDADKAPITVTNFMNLVNEKFYDGLTFHRIIKGFMIQGGDPEGTDAGGSVKTIRGEFSANGIENDILHERGVISMARTGNDMNSASSQFFIVQETNTNLDGLYASFGHVTSGMDVVDKICEVKPISDSSDGLVEKSKQPIIEYMKEITE